MGSDVVISHTPDPLAIFGGVDPLGKTEGKEGEREGEGRRRTAMGYLPAHFSGASTA